MSTARPDGKAYVNPLAQDQQQLKEVVTQSISTEPTQETEHEALAREIYWLEPFQTLLASDGRISKEWRVKIPSTPTLEQRILKVLKTHNLSQVEVLASKFEHDDSVLLCIREKGDRALQRRFKSRNDRAKEPLGIRKPF